jgi:acetolactate synthase-1/2/3 large subunit
MNSASVSSRVADALMSTVTDVFGVMGNGNVWFLDALVATPGVRYTAVRHEAAAVAAADAYARAGGGVAVATTTYGPGFTNTLTALAEAVQARVPLVLVVGDAPRSGPRPWDVDQTGIASNVGAPTFVVDRAEPGAIARRALRHAIDARTAVVLAIPYDLADLAADEEQTPTADLAGPAATAPDLDQVAHVAELLSGASRPLLLAGRGASLAGVGDAIGELADRLGALTATTALGLGMFSRGGDGDAGDLGVAGGFASELSAELIAQADVVLAIGAGLSQFTMRFGEAFGVQATVVQNDIAERATHPRVDVFLRGDAALSVRALLAAIEPDQRVSSWRADTAELRRGERAARPAGDPLAPDGRLDPRTLTRRLDEVLPLDRTIVQDGGHFIGWAPTYLRVPAPNRLIMVGTAFQTIGLGLASAVGAGRAQPGSTIVLCSGDGGALMGLADLETAVRSIHRGVIVIFNDAAYGAEIHQYGIRGVDTAPMLIDEVDFAALGRALGAEGAVVRTLDDLAELESWFARTERGVFVADCRVSREIVAPYMAEIVAHAR